MTWDINLIPRTIFKNSFLFFFLLFHAGIFLCTILLEKIASNQIQTKVKNDKTKTNGVKIIFNIKL